MYHVCIQVYSFHRKGQVVVASFMSASHRLEAPGKRGPQLRRCPHPTRLWAVPALGWRSWVLQESRLSKPISSAPLLQLPPPGSCTDVSWEWSVTRELRVEVSHFPLVTTFVHSNRTSRSKTTLRSRFWRLNSSHWACGKHLNWLSHLIGYYMLRF